jgi:hypothetical protein
MPGSGLLLSSLLPRPFTANLHFFMTLTPTAALITLAAATVASGATAALFHYRFRYYRALYLSMKRREDNHLTTIFSLQRQLTDAKRVPTNH